MNYKDFYKLNELEEALWIPATRFNKEFMESVLSPEFFEFGRFIKRRTLVGVSIFIHGVDLVCFNIWDVLALERCFRKKRRSYWMPMGTNCYCFRTNWLHSISYSSQL